MDMRLVFLLGLLPDHKNKNDGLKACLDGAAGTGPRFTNFACRAATDGSQAMDSMFYAKRGTFLPDLMALRRKSPSNSSVKSAARSRKPSASALP